MTAHSNDLYSLTRAELFTQIESWGFHSLNAARLWNYLYVRGETDFTAMTELPSRLREHLLATAFVTTVNSNRESHSSDGFTKKFLLGLGDQQQIETVLMHFTGRITACVSSQAGCALGCVFCATGQIGFNRNLTAGEIVAQAMHVVRDLRRTNSNENGKTVHVLRNIVVMGMGEPLQNYDAVMRALDITRDQSGLAIGARRITISTVGIVPGIVRMADEGRPYSLAVSLHAATQDERAAMIPVARAWPLDELMSACRYYSRKLKRRIFFEWTVIDGENDSLEQAHCLANLIRGIPSQINLIPLNSTVGFSGQPGCLGAVRQFQATLQSYGIPTTVRQRRGIDIAAGCGQLAGETAH